MRYLFIIAVLLTFMHSAQSGDLRYLSAADDIPLMTGLEEWSERSVLFDKPGGRIATIITYDNGASFAEDDVLYYYTNTLPQLGWIQINRNLFRNKYEQLSLSFEKENNMLIVSFNLQPLGP